VTAPRRDRRRPAPRRRGARLRPPGVPRQPRVDIANEAGVAHGLVYHYFTSKDEVLDTVFRERWGLLLDHIRAVDAVAAPARYKLGEIAGLHRRLYRHDPDVMKVIIVEVTRAANSFGRTHLPEIREAYGLIADIVAAAQEDGQFREGISPQFAAMAFYGAIEQVLTGWIFAVLPHGEAELDQAKDFIVETICGGLARVPSDGSDRTPEWTMTSSSASSGPGS
jgi:AcrR family transcriptional regulator